MATEEVTLGYDPLLRYTDDELIRLVFSSNASNMELELARRLTDAMNMVDSLKSEAPLCRPLRVRYDG